jgi:hypothetical protein
MFEQVSKAIRQLRYAVRDLDPSRIDGGQARGLVEEFAAIERLAAAGKAIAMRRVEETRAWAQAGAFRDGAAWLAATTGTTVSAARATIDTAERLEEFPTRPRSSPTSASSSRPGATRGGANVPTRSHSTRSSRWPARPEGRRGQMRSGRSWSEWTTRRSGAVTPSQARCARSQV